MRTRNWGTEYAEYGSSAWGGQRTHAEYNWQARSPLIFKFIVQNWCTSWRGMALCRGSWSCYEACTWSSLSLKCSCCILWRCSSHIWELHNRICSWWANWSCICWWEGACMDAIYKWCQLGCTWSLLTLHLEKTNHHKYTVQCIGDV